MTPRRAKQKADDIVPEYDFSDALPNPYAGQVGSDVTVVLLDADVAEAFPDARSVNEALRALAKIAKRPTNRTRSQKLRRTR